MLTIAVCNQKGGVGKSTTTYHLARAAQRVGDRVLVVDMDPQANITSTITPEGVCEDAESIADVLSSRTPTRMSDIITQGVWDNVSVAPSAGDTLATVRDELVISGAGRETRLREALEVVSGHYDVCLIDCAPALDQLTLNALSAADKVLIVTHAKLWSANGLARLLATVEDVQRYYNPDLDIAGIVVNQFEARTLAAGHWHRELKGAAQQRGIYLFEPHIPKRTMIADCVEGGIGLDECQGRDAEYLAFLYMFMLDQIATGQAREFEQWKEAQR